jgi:hypothetical protein
MKALKLIVIGMLVFFAGSAEAQIAVNVNIGTPPQWGPVGYSDARYYYIPDVEAYYDVPSSMFIYLNNGVWVHRSYLPNRYRNYDLYRGYKVVMTDYHGNSPYSHFKEYKVKYAKGYHGQQQKNYGEKAYSNQESKSNSGHKSGQDNHQRNEHGKGNHWGNGNGHKK